MSHACFCFQCAIFVYMHIPREAGVTVCVFVCACIHGCYLCLSPCLPCLYPSLCLHCNRFIRGFFRGFAKGTSSRWLQGTMTSYLPPSSLHGSRLFDEGSRLLKTSASSLPHHCIITPSSLHRHCTVTASSLHPHCIISAECCLFQTRCTTIYYRINLPPNSNFQDIPMNSKAKDNPMTSKKLSRQFHMGVLPSHSYVILSLSCVILTHSYL